MSFRYAVKANARRDGSQGKFTDQEFVFTSAKPSLDQMQHGGKIIAALRDQWNVEVNHLCHGSLVELTD